MYTKAHQPCFHFSLVCCIGSGPQENPKFALVGPRQDEAILLQYNNVNLGTNAIGIMQFSKLDFCEHSDRTGLFVHGQPSIFGNSYDSSRIPLTREPLTSSKGQSAVRQHAFRCATAVKATETHR